MKNSKIKLVTACLMLVFAMQISCSENEPQVKQRTLDLKFPAKGEAGGKTFDSFTNYNVLIRSLKPLVISSGDLKVVNVVNTETGELTSAIILNEDQEFESAIGKKAPTEERGYVYDGDDCFIYGTITTYSDGSKTFEPASYETQAVMNRCGYANVA